MLDLRCVKMMPIFAGAPWVPKFVGSKQGLKFSEWKEKIISLIDAAAYIDGQAVSLFMGSLQGGGQM